jgi:hypothetical protein
MLIAHKINCALQEVISMGSFVDRFPGLAKPKRKVNKQQIADSIINNEKGFDTWF